jgi:hypothetical protein
VIGRRLLRQSRRIVSEMGSKLVGFMAGGQGWLFRSL